MDAFSGLRRQVVAMVQPAEAWVGLNLASIGRGDIDCAPRRRILREPQVGSVFVVVAHVLRHQVPYGFLVREEANS